MDKKKDSKEPKDVEMEQKKEEEVKQEKFDPYLEIRKQLILLEKAVEMKDTKTCGVVARNFKRIRAEFSLKDVGLVYDHYLPDLSAKINLPKYDPDIVKFDVEDKLHLNKERAGVLTKNFEAK